MRAHIPSVTRTARRRCAVAAAALAAATACGIAAAQVVSHLIAGGGGVSHSPGGCRTLEGALGETAVGTSSGAGFTLQAGYWASAGNQRRDSLFRNGFEECQ